MHSQTKPLLLDRTEETILRLPLCSKQVCLLLVEGALLKIYFIWKYSNAHSLSLILCAAINFGLNYVTIDYQSRYSSACIYGRLIISRVLSRLFHITLTNPSHNPTPPSPPYPTLSVIVARL